MIEEINKLQDIIDKGRSIGTIDDEIGKELLKMSIEILDKYNNQKNDESPYCEVCGTCGHIGCCGIRNFIKEHIEGKTNCKNEAYIIDEIISLCEYKDDVFKENEKLLNFKNAWEELKEDCREAEKANDYILYERLQQLEQKNNIGGVKK